jgi:hypothetical protein
MMTRKYCILYIGSNCANTIGIWRPQSLEEGTKNCVKGEGTP